MIRQILREGRDPERAAASRAEGPAALHAVKNPPIKWLDPPPGPWTVERAYHYCEEFVRAHTESFPVASRLVPAEIRPYLMALYAFARSADDFADEPQYEGRRIEALDRWEDELGRCCHGEATHPVFVALADTIERRVLHGPRRPALRDLSRPARLHRALGRSRGAAAAGPVRLPASRAGALRGRDLDGPSADQLLAGRGR